MVKCKRCQKTISKNSTRSIYSGNFHFCGTNCYKKYYNLKPQKYKHGTRR